MKLLHSLAAGFAGALALTALHETARRLRPHDAPRMDVLGERGLRKILRLEELPQPSEGLAYTATILGDILSNGLYYSLIGSGKHRLGRGVALGALAGVGGVVLPGPLGLGTAPSNRTRQTQVMTVAWYTFGGLVAGAVAQALHRSYDAAEPGH